jgi:hypothetical protein
MEWRRLEVATALAAVLGGGCGPADDRVYEGELSIEISKGDPSAVPAAPLASASRHTRFHWHREDDFASFNEVGTSCNFHGEVKTSGNPWERRVTGYVHGFKCEADFPGCGRVSGFGERSSGSIGVSRKLATVDGAGHLPSGEVISFTFTAR